MWIDAIIVAIFIFFLWRGYEKGFLNNFVYLIGWVVSIGIAWYYWRPVKTFLENHLQLAEDFATMIEKKIMAIVVVQENAGQSIDAAKASGLFGIPEKITEFIQNAIITAGQNSAVPVAEMMADICLGILAFLVVVLLGKIVTNLIIKTFQGVGKVPVVSTINELFGMAMGGLKGIIVIFLLLMFMVPVLAVTDNEILIEAYRNARIVPFLYDHNPIFIFWKG